MKNMIKLVLGLALVLSAGWVQAAESFEGELDMKITAPRGKTVTVQYFVKGHKARTMVTTEDEKFSGGGIYDWQAKQMTIILDQQKMYMVGQVHPEKYQSEYDKHLKVTKTDKTLVILGHKCQEWDYTSENDNGKVWMTPGIGSWWGSQMAAQSDKVPSDQKALVKLVVEQKLFPMKWETADKSGKPLGSGEVTKIEKKSLSSSLFQPPAGYKKMTTPNFGGATGGKKMTKEDIMKMMEQYKK